MQVSNALKIGGGIVLVLLVLAVVTAIGAVSVGLSFATVAIVLWFIGVVSKGTAMAIIVWGAVLGGILGLLKGVVGALMAS